MKVGVLGTGDVGRALGKAFIELGHQVKMGSRTAGNEKAAEWQRQAGDSASTGTFEETVKWADLVVLATLGAANESVVGMAKADNFAGKVVIDTTNPLDNSKGMPALAVGFSDSGGEQVQRLLPGARVVKAFNTVGNAHMFKPDFPGGPPDMFICGNDDGAKKDVGKLLEQFGWGVIDLGGIECSRYLEPMCLVWVLHGVRSGAWNHAFKMLHK